MKDKGENGRLFYVTARDCPCEEVAFRLSLEGAGHRDSREGECQAEEEQVHGPSTRGTKTCHPREPLR